jgi:hypothetical protein
MTQLVKCLPSTHETLSSNPSTENRERKEKEREREIERERLKNMAFNA